MTTHHPITLETAVAQLLDTLMAGRSVTLDSMELEGGFERLDRLIAALHGEARRRGVGVAIEPKEGGALCLSLRRP